MKTAIYFAALLLLLIFPAMPAHARLVQPETLQSLMKDSQLVFVGQVKSVTPSGITTGLSYPSWEKVTFEWLRVEVEVIGPIKGTKTGKIVSTLMLSAPKPYQMNDHPGMVEPEVGQYHLHCLLPTTLKGEYASFTAPFDDDVAILRLDRNHWSRWTHFKDGKPVAFQEQSEENRTLWDLTDDNGGIDLDGVQRLRKKYAKEIAAHPAKNDVIYLKWKKVMTSPYGWYTTVPDKGKAVDEYTLTAAKILEIARVAVTRNDDWIKQAKFDKPVRQPDGSWIVLVKRRPETPEGHRSITIAPDGEVTEYGRGIENRK